MFFCHVADQFLDKDRLANTCTAEQTDLSALGVGCDQINDLDTRLQNLLYGLLVCKSRRPAVDLPALSAQLLPAVNRITEYVEQPSQIVISHRNGDSAAERDDRHILLKSFARSQQNTANGMITDMLRHFHDAFFPVVVTLKGRLDAGKRQVVKFHIDNRSHDLRDFSNLHTVFLHLPVQPLSARTRL